MNEKEFPFEESDSKLSNANDKIYESNAELNQKKLRIGLYTSNGKQSKKRGIERFIVVKNTSQIHCLSKAHLFSQLL